MATDNGIRKVMVAYDGSPDSMKAAKTACMLAGKFGSEVVLVHVYYVPLYYQAGPSGGALPDTQYLERAAEERAAKILGEGADIVKECGAKCRTEILRAPSIVQALVEFAEKEDPNMLIVGTRGMTGFKKLIMGSVSSGLVGHAKCPVLVVR